MLFIRLTRFSTRFIRGGVGGDFSMYFKASIKDMDSPPFSALEHREEQRPRSQTWKLQQCLPIRASHSTHHPRIFGIIQTYYCCKEQLSSHHRSLALRVLRTRRPTPRTSIGQSFSGVSHGVHLRLLNMCQIRAAGPQACQDTDNI